MECGGRWGGRNGGESVWSGRGDVAHQTGFESRAPQTEFAHLSRPTTWDKNPIDPCASDRVFNVSLRCSSPVGIRPLFLSFTLIFSSFYSPLNFYMYFSLYSFSFDSSFNIVIRIVIIVNHFITNIFSLLLFLLNY